MEIKNISYKIIFLILAILLIIFIKPNETFAYIGSVSKAKITLDKTSYVYTGEKIKRGITEKIGDEKLKKDKDYTVSYSNNVEAGTAKITIKGKGLLCWGSTSKTFNITKKDIKDTRILFTRRSFYTGKKVKPNLSITLGSKVLKENEDYILSCTNNIKVGTAKVTIQGKGNFTGSITKTFKINKRSIEDTKITLNKESFKYTGKAFKPGVTITYNKRTLKKGTDYTVSYVNNTNAGKAKAIIEGKGSFTGIITKVFVIKPANIEDVTVENTKAYMLGLDSSLKIKYNGKLLRNNVDYRINVKQNYSLENATSEFKVLNWELEYEIIGINNFNETKSSNDIGIVDGIVHYGIVDRNSSRYNYNYINRKLNYALNKYYININKAIIREHSFYKNHDLPLLQYEYADNSFKSLEPGEDFTYKKENNKWIITGINSFYGTREIMIKN